MAQERRTTRVSCCQFRLFFRAFFFLSTRRKTKEMSFFLSRKEQISFVSNFAYLCNLPGNFRLG